MNLIICSIVIFALALIVSLIIRINKKEDKGTSVPAITLSPSDGENLPSKITDSSEPKELSETATASVSAPLATPTSKRSLQRKPRFQRVDQLTKKTPVPRYKMQKKTDYR